MHLVVAGFKQKYEVDLASGGTSQKDALWWFGYLIGLLEGGLITEDEYDELGSLILETSGIEEATEKFTPEVIFKAAAQTSKITTQNAMRRHLEAEETDLGHRPKDGNTDWDFENEDSPSRSSCR